MTRLALTCCSFVILNGVILAQTDPSVGTAQSQGSDMAELAKKLNNPTASLINVPLQSNFDFGGGPSDDGFQYKLNIQPVIPFDVNENWKILSRTIVPYIYQEDRIGTGSEDGLGDSTVTLWLSPSGTKTREGLTWGVGPVFQLPTATDDLLGFGKWGLGPSAVLLSQSRGWTVGVLAQHIWSFAGEDNRQDVSASFMQPFINYTTRAHTTFGINTESIYDWENEEWTVPLNLFVTQLSMIGKMPVSFQFGGRIYADKPTGGPDWGLRFTVTLVFSK
jgi:hypothetical protein